MVELVALPEQSQYKTEVSTSLKYTPWAGIHACEGEYSVRSINR